MTIAALPMTEKQMQAAIVQCARQHSWNVYFTFDSRHSPAGFPDIIAIRNGELLVLELKTAKRRVSNFQRWWLDAFRDVPCAEVYVVREGEPNPGELGYEHCLARLSRRDWED